MTRKEEKLPTRQETIWLALAVRDAYLGFDSEDYCDRGIGKHIGEDKCIGCIQYDNLARAYKVALRLLPKKEQPK